MLLGRILLFLSFGRSKRNGKTTTTKNTRKVFDNKNEALRMCAEGGGTGAGWGWAWGAGWGVGGRVVVEGAGKYTPDSQYRKR